MFLSRIAKWLAGPQHDAGARRRPTARPSLEGLEERHCLSWTAAPSTMTEPPLTHDANFNSLGRTGVATISHGEVDVYEIVAPRTGYYTFKAGAHGSHIDTVAALYRTSPGTM